MTQLGLDPLQAPVEMTAGVGANNVTHFCDVEVDLGVTQLPVFAGFTTGLDHLGLGLLGQNGFFDSFKVTFDKPNGVYLLESSDSADEIQRKK